MIKKDKIINLCCQTTPNLLLIFGPDHEIKE
jgi:hypothetical protein